MRWDTARAIPDLPPPTDQPSPRRRWWHTAVTFLAGLAFIVVPWVTYGYGTPLEFAVLAVVLRLRRGKWATWPWLAAAAYAALAAVALAIGDLQPMASPDHLTAACGGITTVLGGMHALAVVSVGHARGTWSVGPPPRVRAARPERPELLSVVRFVALAAGGFIGAVLFLQGGLAALHGYHIATYHRPAIARVVQLTRQVTGTTQDGEPYYTPAVVVEFETSPGTSHRATVGYRVRDNGSMYVERPLWVYYDTGDASDASLVDGHDQAVRGLLAFVVGLPLLWPACIAFARSE